MQSDLWLDAIQGIHIQLQMKMNKPIIFTFFPPVTNNMPLKRLYSSRMIWTLVLPNYCKEDCHLWQTLFRQKAWENGTQMLALPNCIIWAWSTHFPAFLFFWRQPAHIVSWAQFHKQLFIDFGHIQIVVSQHYFCLASGVYTIALPINKFSS